MFRKLIVNRYFLANWRCSYWSILSKSIDFIFKYQWGGIHLCCNFGDVIGNLRIKISYPISILNVHAPTTHQINTAQKMKFSIKDFFSICDQIRRKLRIRWHILKKSLMKYFIFCAAEYVKLKLFGLETGTVILHLIIYWKITKWET